MQCIIHNQMHIKASTDRNHDVASICLYSWIIWLIDFCILNNLLKYFTITISSFHSLIPLATILIGVILSLIIVCVLDFLFPPKMENVQRYQKLNPADEDKDSESNKRNLRSSKKEDTDDDELVRDSQPLTEKKQL